MKYIILAFAVMVFASSCTFNKVPVDSAGVVTGGRNVFGVEVGILDHKIGTGVWINPSK